MNPEERSFATNGTTNIHDTPGNILSLNKFEYTEKLLEIWDSIPKIELRDVAKNKIINNINKTFDLDILYKSARNILSIISYQFVKYKN